MRVKPTILIIALLASMLIPTIASLHTRTALAGACLVASSEAFVAPGITAAFLRDKGGVSVTFTVCDSLQDNDGSGFAIPNPGDGVRESGNLQITSPNLPAPGYINITMTEDASDNSVYSGTATITDVAVLPGVVYALNTVLLTILFQPLGPLSTYLASFAYAGGITIDNTRPSLIVTGSAFSTGICPNNPAFTGNINCHTDSYATAYGTMTLTSVDAGSGLKTIKVDFLNGTTLTFSASPTAPAFGIALAPGLTKISASATDNAGNVRTRTIWIERFRLASTGGGIDTVGPQYTWDIPLYVCTASAACIADGFDPGWNLISFPIIPDPTTTAPSVMFQDIIPFITPGTAIWVLQGSTFLHWAPGASGNTLTSVVDGQAIWINVNRNTHLFVYGRNQNLAPLPPKNAYNLILGWNGIGTQMATTGTFTFDTYLASYTGGTDESVTPAYIDTFWWFLPSTQTWVSGIDDTASVLSTYGWFLFVTVAGTYIPP